MPEILKSFPLDDLPTKPPIGGKIRVSDDIQQALSMLVGWDGISRRLIRCSPTGALYASQPRARGVLNVLATSGNFTWQGDDIKTSEVLIKSHPNNTGLIWINVGIAAAADVGYPLAGGDNVTISIISLRSLHLIIVTDTEKASIIYTD